ncbi:uncharacterized protein [Branchiostoma lanceolatum]|uniref:uncharacterized protein isoform X2 n=1 Tax=Branchiostoma lanceolatum TaxID=7740 RepID=UPI0034519A78
MYQNMGTMYDEPDDIHDGEANSGGDRPQSPPLSHLRRSGRHKARAPDNAQDDHDFVNHFWPLFSHTVLEDVRDNTGVIVPVPRLQTDAAAYRPLQIFHDRLEHSVVRSLSNVQRKVVSMGGGGGTLVRMGRRMGLRLEGLNDTIVSQEIYLREEHFHTATPKDSHIQVIRRRNIRPNGGGPPAVAKIKVIFDVAGVTKLTTPPRDLQGVRVDSVQDVGAHRYFNYIYETFLAEYVKCKTVSGGTGVAEPQTRVGVVRNCPIAYRFAKIKVNRDGVVTTVDLNVTSRDLRNLAVPKVSMADVVSITGNW